jgi:hypothetical protein
VNKINASFANVGAYSSEENLIRGDPKGVIEWISGEAEAFEEILSDRGDVARSSVCEGFQLSWRRRDATISRPWPRTKLPCP